MFVPASSSFGNGARTFTVQGSTSGISPDGVPTTPGAADTLPGGRVPDTSRPQHSGCLGQRVDLNEAVHLLTAQHKGVRHMASTTTARTIEPRDAAITAAIAGAVLVVLGYASGIGVRPAGEVTAALPPQAAPPVAAAPLTPAPAAVVAADPPPAMSVPAPAPAGPVATAQQPMALPTPTPAAPAAEASATAHTDETPAAPDQPTCSPDLVTSLLGNVPIVSGLTAEVSGLLSGLTGSLLTSPVAGPTDPTDGTDATGLLGGLAGTACDATAARTTLDPTP